MLFVVVGKVAGLPSSLRSGVHGECCPPIFFEPPIHSFSSPHFLDQGNATGLFFVGTTCGIDTSTKHHTPSTTTKTKTRRRKREMNISNILRNTCAAMIPSLSPSRVALIEEFGAKIIPLDPIGAAVEGIDLRSKDPPPEPVRQALEEEMANRGFIVFRNNDKMTADEFVEASTWWGARAIHSTHGVVRFGIYFLIFFK